jgi:hypothetical protein
VNFSSARVLRLNFQREVEMEQWTDFIPKFCDRVTRAFADAAVLAGKVRKPNYERRALHAEVGLRQSGAGRQGRPGRDRRRTELVQREAAQARLRPEQVFGELASDIKVLKGNGSLDVMLQLLKGNALQDGNAQADQAKKPAAAAD